MTYSLLFKEKILEKASPATVLLSWDLLSQQGNGRGSTVNWKHSRKKKQHISSTLPGSCTLLILGLPPCTAATAAHRGLPTGSTSVRLAPLGFERSAAVSGSGVTQKKNPSGISHDCPSFRKVLCACICTEHGHWYRALSCAQLGALSAHRNPRERSIFGRVLHTTSHVNKIHVNWG